MEHLKYMQFSYHALVDSLILIKELRKECGAF